MEGGKLLLLSRQGAVSVCIKFVGREEKAREWMGGRQTKGWMVRDRIRGKREVLSLENVEQIIFLTGI